MFFLSDCTVEFSKRGRDRKKRKPKISRKDRRDVRADLNTGVQTSREIRGSSREVRGWLSLASKLGAF